MSSYLKVVPIFVFIMLVTNVNASSNEPTKSSFRKLHLSIGYSNSYSVSKDQIDGAYLASGFYRGRDLSDRGSYKFEATFRWAPKLQSSFGKYNLPIVINGTEKTDNHTFGPRSSSEGDGYYFAIDYILIPFKNRLDSKWELAVGIGLSYINLKFSSDMGYIRNPPPGPNTMSESWEINKNSICGLLRSSIDYYFSNSISFQLRIAGWKLPSTEVPEQTFLARTLDAHNVNHSTFEISTNFVLHKY